MSYLFPCLLLLNSAFLESSPFLFLDLNSALNYVRPNPYGPIQNPRRCGQGSCIFIGFLTTVTLVRTQQLRQTSAVTAAVHAQLAFSACPSSWKSLKSILLFQLHTPHVLFHSLGRHSRWQLTVWLLSLQSLWNNGLWNPWPILLQSGRGVVGRRGRRLRNVFSRHKIHHHTKMQQSPPRESQAVLGSVLPHQITQHREDEHRRAKIHISVWGRVLCTMNSF